MARGAKLRGLGESIWSLHSKETPPEMCQALMRHKAMGMRHKPRARGSPVHQERRRGALSIVLPPSHGHATHGALGMRGRRVRGKGEGSREEKEEGRRRKEEEGRRRKVGGEGRREVD